VIVSVVSGAAGEKKGPELNVGGRSIIVSVNGFATVAPAPSATFTVNEYIPVLVGVPASTPELLSASPGGKAPAVMDHVNGAVPPDSAVVCEYATVAAPFGMGEVVVIAIAPLIVIVSAWVAPAPAESVTLTVKVDTPAATGVPLNTPPALKVSPAGSEPVETNQVSGAVPPVAASVCE
jgi:hypothetical protein